jgi:hypothetical protein
MKKSILLLLILILGISLLAGCGSKPANQSDEPVDTGSVDIDEGRIDAGNISAVCPEGWKNIPVEGDDKDTADPNELKFYKGVKDDGLYSFLPSVAISYDNNGPLGADKEWLEGEDLDPIEIGGRTWEGFTFEWSGDKCAKLITEDGGVKIAVTIWLDLGLESISLDDPDVREIITSIKHK